MSRCPFPPECTWSLLCPDISDICRFPARVPAFSPLLQNALPRSGTHSFLPVQSLATSQTLLCLRKSAATLPRFAHQDATTVAAFFFDWPATFRISGLPPRMASQDRAASIQILPEWLQAMTPHGF